ncbi:MAG: tetratricopeptide repeat protein [gamma proteobacterium symbiont of Phacoides pectinatus]
MSARLRELRPAYEAYDQGRKALAGGETKQALALAEQALGLESSEALFHGLKGEALARQGRTGEAESAYNRAVDLDPGFFRHYLQRGEVRLKQGRWGEAQADLKRSLALLPTADAQLPSGSAGIAWRRPARRPGALSQCRRLRVGHRTSGRGRAGADPVAGSAATLPWHPPGYRAGIVGGAGLQRHAPCG